MIASARSMSALSPSAWVRNMGGGGSAAVVAPPTGLNELEGSDFCPVVLVWDNNAPVAPLVFRLAPAAGAETAAWGGKGRGGAGLDDAGIDAEDRSAPSGKTRRTWLLGDDALAGQVRPK